VQNPDFSPSEARNAQRAYVQRCEVRLSTMHRIAGAFVSGAALLILLPLFLKDVMSPIVRAFLSPFLQNTSQLPGWTVVAIHALPFSIAFLEHFPLDLNRGGFPNACQ
jgi:hypothetical protein